MANAIETTISINDNMTKAFRNVTSAVNTLISSMEDLNRSSANAIDTRSLESARRSIANAEAAFNGVQDEIDKARDSQDKLNDKINQGTTATDKLKSSFSGVGTVIKTAAKAAAALTAAGSAAVGAVVTKSVSSYADYEQLKGGVETLFGAGGKSLEEYAKSEGKSVSEVSSQYDTLLSSQQTVLDNADKAFATAGLSANDYMETVTGFSASLLQSLGGDTVKAAEYADRAIIDMSDNANKMGTDMESIQNAYQGFAKQNYTMLDNLKLGYGGTKEEMERLIEDASKMTDVQNKLGLTVDASSMSFGNIVNAISVMQESMDIAGTTADEAKTTISGSLNSMKAAWQNTLTALVRGGDNFDSCIDNLVSTAEIFADNITPAIAKALNGMGKLIEGLAPVIEQKLPEMISSLLPSLITATTSMIKGFIKALPDIAQIIVDALPDVVAQIDAGIAEVFDFGGSDGIFSTLLDSISGLAKALAPIAEAMGSFISKNAKLIPVIAGGVLAFKALSKALTGMEKIKSALSAFKGGNPVTAGLTKSLEAIAKLKVTVVSKAVLNIGIIVGGITAIVAILAAVAPLIAGLSDFSSLMQLVAAIAAVGAVGSALAAFAGMVGAIPIPTVLLGLANIALVIGGMTAIIAAFAALGQMPGFDDFMQSGGEVLSKLFGTVGEICGSFIGGIGTGITDALPDIAKNITAFVEELKPMFEAVSGVDMTGVSEFFSSMGSFLLQMTGQQFLSIFAGDLNLSGIASQLTSFADESKGFFTAVATFPEAGFTNAALLFQALADIGNVPNSGGIAQWFSGTNDFSGLAEGLKQLSSDSVLNFFAKVANIPETAFTNASNFFKALGDISNVPNSGGIAQWFSGENDFSGLADGLGQLASDGVIHFFTVMSELPDTGFTKATEFFETLGSLKDIPSEIKLTDLGEQLETLADSVQSFITQINNLKTENVSAFSSALKNLSTAAAQSCTKIKSELTAMAKAVNEKLIQAVSYAKKQGENIKTALSKVSLTQTGKDIIQGLINGMKAKESALATYAQTLAATLSNTVNKGLEVGSPSRVMYRTGVFAVEGLTLGIAKNIRAVEKAALSLTDVITAPTPSIAGQAQNSQAVNAVAKPERFKSMREIVSSKTNNYTTVRPTINVSVKNANTINNDVDMSRLARSLANGIAQQIGLELEGVY